MYLKDDLGLDWIPHFFVLTYTQLSYTEMTTDQDINDDTASIEEASDQDDPSVVGTAKRSKKNEDELHFSEGSETKCFVFFEAIYYRIQCKKGQS